MTIKYPKGSEWFKWDLHVHTPASAFAHSLGSDWNIFIEKLIDAINAQGISAIATADYFSIDGYIEILKYYDKTTKILTVNGKSAKVLIIPGVELRLNIFNSDEESINIHVLFDPEKCSPNFIIEHFLEELKVNYRGTEYSLKTSTLLAIGKSISRGTSLNVGEDFSSVVEADKKAFTKTALATITLIRRDINESLKDIDEVFESQKLPSKSYMVCIVGKGHGGINSLKWFEDNKQTQFSRAGLIREDLTHQADIIFSNDKGDRGFYLGKASSTPENEVRERFSNLKPCVWGSDSHNFDNLLIPSNGNTRDFTWIKAEISFEGLKQIIYEPELRVRIQEENPSDSETFAKVEKCTIDFPADLKIQDKESTEAIDFCFRGKYEIEFSNNLTCIVGGRGSGKSTIVHILYNSWVSNPAKLIELSSPLTSLKFPSKDPLGKIRSLTQVKIPANTEFYLQNEIEKFAKDIQEMSKLIRHRLEKLSSLDESKKSIERLELEWKEASLQYDELVSAYDNITDKNEKIDLLKQRIETLKKQTSVIKSDEYKVLQKEIEGITNAINDFETYEKEYKKTATDLSFWLKNINKLNWTKYGGQEVLDKIKAIISSSQDELPKIFALTKEEFAKNQYPEKLTTKKNEFKKYLKEKGLSEENIGELADATQEIAGIEYQIQELNCDIIPFEELYTQKEIILSDYKARYTTYRDRYFEVSASLQSSLSGLKFSERQTEITFHPKINDQLLKDKIVSYIKEHNTSKIALNAGNVESVLFGDEALTDDFVTDKQKIIDAVNGSQKATAHTQVLQEILGNALFQEKLFLRMQRYHFDIHNIQAQTKIGEKLLQSTSFGERCGIVVAIVLVAGTNPIIIDQPEDNLDGKFISNVLVPLIRKQKYNRQIILITRDANLVIGGDSELIEILESTDTCKTENLSATIENNAARPKYIWILDGGEKAFQTREAKYNII